MTSLNFGNISLKHFLERTDTAENVVSSQMLKQMQHGAFALLWDKCDTSVVRVYATLGKVFSSVQALSETESIMRQRLARQPMCGLIRSRTAHGDDFRFVAFVHKTDSYIVLENAALDSKLAVLWKYERDCEGFVEHRGAASSVLEFLIEEEVAVV